MHLNDVLVFQALEELADVDFLLEPLAVLGILQDLVLRYHLQRIFLIFVSRQKHAAKFSIPDVAHQFVVADLGLHILAKSADREEGVVEQLVPLNSCLVIVAQHASNELLHFRRNGYVSGRKIYILLFHVFQQQKHVKVLLEGVTIEKHVVEHDAQAENVDFVSQVLALALQNFRRSDILKAELRVSQEIWPQERSLIEICDFECDLFGILPVSDHGDVLECQVSVDDFGLVVLEVPKSVQELLHQVLAGVLRQRALLTEISFEVALVVQLLHDVDEELILEVLDCSH